MLYGTEIANRYQNYQLISHQLIKSNPLLQPTSKSRPLWCPPSSRVVAPAPPSSIPSAAAFVPHQVPINNHIIVVPQINQLFPMFSRHAILLRRPHIFPTGNVGGGGLRAQRRRRRLRIRSLLLLIRRRHAQDGSETAIPDQGLHLHQFAVERPESELAR
jgi:hypothetical protein